MEDSQKQGSLINKLCDMSQDKWTFMKFDGSSWLVIITGLLHWLSGWSYQRITIDGCWIYTLEWIYSTDSFWRILMYAQRTVAGVVARRLCSTYNDHHLLWNVHDVRCHGMAWHDLTRRDTTRHATPLNIILTYAFKPNSTETYLLNLT